MTVLCINISLGHISRDSCAKKFKDEFQIGGGGVNAIGSRYIYIYILLLPCAAVDLYSDVVECLPVQFPAGMGWNVVDSSI